MYPINCPMLTRNVTWRATSVESRSVKVYRSSLPNSWREITQNMLGSFALSRKISSGSRFWIISRKIHCLISDTTTGASPCSTCIEYRIPVSSPRATRWRRLTWNLWDNNDHSAKLCWPSRTSCQEVVSVLSNLLRLPWFHSGKNFCKKNII
jgi:hypothetical protein